MSTEEPEFEELEEMLTDFRDRLVASDILQAGEAGESVVAGLIGMLRLVGQNLDNHAMILRRIPDSREMIAEQLEETARVIEGMVPPAEEVES